MAASSLRFTGTQDKAKQVWQTNFIFFEPSERSQGCMRNSAAWNGPLQPPKCQDICQVMLKVARSSANGERDLDDELFRLLPCLFYHDRRSEHAVLHHSVNLPLLHSLWTLAGICTCQAPRMTGVSP
jgi:hypothetical protein